MTESRLCCVCDRRELAADEPQTCVHCLGRARANLRALVDAYALLPSEVTDRGGVSFEPVPTGARETALLGGEALVLLAGGSLVADDPEALPGDPMPPKPVLLAWAADWRRRTGRARVVRGALVDVVGYLDRQLGWAAQHHPEFAEFCGDVFRLRARVEAVTSAREPLDRGARIPCPECGEPLVRYYADPRACPHVPVAEAERPCAPLAGVWRGYGRVEPRRKPQNGTQPGELPEQWAPCGCDQGGRRDAWHCPNRACGRVVTNREYHFAVWASLENG